MSDKHDDLWQIHDSMDDLIEMIIDKIQDLPPEYRIGDEEGGEALGREILQPLMDVQSTITDLIIDESGILDEGSNWA